MRKTTLLIVNSLSLIFALVLNGLQGSALFGGKTIGEVSARYDSLFAPAGYAFAIWGVIYLFLILFVGYQWYGWLRRGDDFELRQTSLWFALANVANGLWVVAWLNDYIAFSVLLIFTLLLSLIMLTIRLRLEVWDAPLRIITFVWWPIVFYLGWIVAASVANVAAWLVSIGWDGGFLSPPTWTVIMIALAMLIYLVLLFTRNMREAALVGIWAFVAIAVRQSGSYDSISYAAIVAAGVLFLMVSWHGYQNRDTSPLKKWQRKEI